MEFSFFIRHLYKKGNFKDTTIFTMNYIEMK